MSSVVIPELADIEAMSPSQLETTLRELDMIRRKVETAMAETVGVADRTVAYVVDGHSTVSAWLRATCNTSNSDTKAVVQCSRLLHAIPQARTAAHAGSLGVAQVRLLAKLHANPRITGQLPDSAGLLVGHAASLPYDDFGVVVQRWETLADADGAHAKHQRAHDFRDAHVSLSGARVYLDGQGGVLAGAAMEEIFTRFCDAEFRSDWDTGLAEWGDTMNPTRLERNDRQRRFDALQAIFEAAAASGVAGMFDPLVNLVVDQTTYEHHLARLAGGHPAPLDPTAVDQRRCETATGHPVDPEQMIAASFIGHVRRVVLDTAGVVIDLGRRSRLFTGGARDAVLLGDRHCIWPGCNRPSGRCQTDHTQAWAARAGPTTPVNGAPMCPHHNRHKERGRYRTWRDPEGRWHTYRPDGTEIGHVDTPEHDTASG
jgi:hypothetical protein